MLRNALIVFSFLSCSFALAQENTEEVCNLDNTDTTVELTIEDFHSSKSSTQSRGTFYKTLEIQYIILNTLDLASTFYGLEKGAREANPIAKGIVKNIPVAIAYKAVLTAGVLVGLNHVRKQNKPVAVIALLALNLVYAYVVGNNINVATQLR